MSFSPVRNFRKRAKSRKIHNKDTDKDKDIIHINPDILTYIQKVQNDKDKIKRISITKNQMSSQVERILTNKLLNANTSSGLNEDMTFDKEKRLSAKKGLLYLLNTLSNGTFCPDIEEYFTKMKDAKVEELRKKAKLLEYSKDTSEKDLKGDNAKKYNLMKKSSSKELSSNNNENNNEEKSMNPFKLNKEKKSEINEKYGLKKYDKDLDAEDLINLYDKKELKDNTFQINYNKEKRFKMKLKKENKYN